MTVASSTLALSLGLATIGVLGTLAGAFLGLISAHRLERKRQAFEREQTARRERAQAMQAARILDSALMEAEALLTKFVVEQKRLWPDFVAVPDRTVWLDLRGDIASLLYPGAWIDVNAGFIFLDRMRAFGAEYRKLGYDETGPDLAPDMQQGFEAVLNYIVSAREALFPVAYPDDIRLPEGHPMLALLAEQPRQSPAPPSEESPS